MWNYITGPLISKEGLHHLDDYGFHGQENSFLAEKFLNSYWNYCVSFVPLWVAPNVLTAVGFVSQMLGFAAMMYYNPDFSSDVPPWVYFFCAFSLFFYQTLDNIDGKQARRTNSSSPLGELFDHVSDSIGVGMMICTVGASCRVGPVLTIIIFFCVVAPFYFHHWEEKFTGELILGRFDGPTESQCFVVVLHCLNGVFALYGYDFWGQEVYGGYNAKVFGALGFCTLAVMSSIKLQVRFWQYVRREGIPFAEAFGVGVPFILFFISAVTYTFLTPNLLQKFNWDECQLLFFFLTILFGYLTSRLIVQRVCKEPSPVIYPISLPLMIAAAHAVLHTYFGAPHYWDPHTVLKVLTTSAMVQCLWFFYALDHELTTYLGIRTFVIPYGDDDKKTKKTKKTATGSAKSSAAQKKESPRRGRSRSPRVVKKKPAAAASPKPKRESSVRKRVATRSRSSSRRRK